MLMKVISMILGFMLDRAAQASSSANHLLTEATLASVRKTLMLVSGVIAGLVMFLGGLFTVLIDMILTTRSVGQISFSQASIVGAALICISFLVGMAMFSRRNWQPVALPAESFDQPKVQPIADALAELIREFTVERKIARDQRTEQMSTASAAASPAYN